MSNKVTALKEMLYKMADDQLILGHRNGEWTGIGPLLEEDIAFGSMAQDKIGHAYHLYLLLEKMGEQDPDIIAFRRDEKTFKCCQLVELPIGDDYAFSLARHFFFDQADILRMEALKNCAYPDLAGLAKKFHSELKYHVFHANIWLKNLLNGTEESKARVKSALEMALPYALGIFEESPHEEILIQENLFIGEKALQEIWTAQIKELMADWNIGLDWSVAPMLGGRNGYHTEHLAPLLNEMTEVLQLEENTFSW